MTSVADTPALPCPECGRPSLLAVGGMLCEVLDCPGPALRPYGMPSVMLPVADACECNHTACGWRGTIKEAKQRKAENSNPTRVSEPSG